MACAKCGNSNKASDKKCYFCNEVLQDRASIRSSDMAVSEESSNSFAGSGNAILTAFLSVALSGILGGVMGYGFSIVDVELPFFLVEVILGVTCAVATAYCIGKFQEMPDGLIGARMLPAGALGAVVGLCLFLIWYAFDPAAGFPMIGAIAGILSGIPIMVSFGLAGGESRPLGATEFYNVIISLGLGFFLGFFICSEDGGIYEILGWTGILGLIPPLFGGRITLASLFNDETRFGS